MLILKHLHHVRVVSFDDESDRLPSESPRWDRDTLSCQQMAEVCASYGVTRRAVHHAALDEHIVSTTVSFRACKAKDNGVPRIANFNFFVAELIIVYLLELNID